MQVASPDASYPGGVPLRFSAGRTAGRYANASDDAALVVQDILGGDLILAEVHINGVKDGNHYWNRLPGGTEVDLTRDQFVPGGSSSTPRWCTGKRTRPGGSVSSTSCCATGCSWHWSQRDLADVVAAHRWREGDTGPMSARPQAEEGRRPA